MERIDSARVAAGIVLLREHDLSDVAALLAKKEKQERDATKRRRRSTREVYIQTRGGRLTKTKMDKELLAKAIKEDQHAGH